MSEHYRQVARCLDDSVESFRAGLKALKYLDPEEYSEMVQWFCGLSMNVESWKLKHSEQLGRRVDNPDAPLDGGSR